MISGALGNVEAYDHAIRGLAEFLMIVLQDDANLSAIDKSKLHSNKTVSTQLVLEELRQLRSKVQSQSDIAPKDFSDEAPKEVSASFGFKEKGNMAFGNMMGSLNVIRTKEWIDKTSAHVNKLLCATFPHVCFYIINRAHLKVVLYKYAFNSVPLNPSYVVDLCSSSKKD